MIITRVIFMQGHDETTSELIKQGHALLTEFKRYRWSVIYYMPFVAFHEFDSLLQP